MGRDEASQADKTLKGIVSKNLNELFANSYYNQTDISKKTAISQASLSKYLQGVSLPSVRNRQLLADVFGVSREYIETDHKNSNINNGSQGIGQVNDVEQGSNSKIIGGDDNATTVIDNTELLESLKKMIENQEIMIELMKRKD